MAALLDKTPRLKKRHAMKIALGPKTLFVSKTNPTYYDYKHLHILHSCFTNVQLEN